jgi:hypothetical protein
MHVQRVADVQDRYAVRGSGQAVAAAHTPLCLDEASTPQEGKDLAKGGLGDSLILG